MEAFTEFCDNLILEYNRKRIIDDRRKEDLIWNYNKLNRKDQETWVVQAERAILKNEKGGLVACASILLLQLQGWPEKLFSVLAQNPSWSKNNWNQIILFQLVEMKFRPLAEEEIVIDQILKTFKNEMAEFQFLMRYIFLNKEYSLKRLCDLIIHHGLGRAKVLETYGHYIYSTLMKCDDSLPNQLIDCAKIGGMDISNLPDFPSL